VADIHILRRHTLSLPEARAIALQWADQARDEFGMDCHFEHSETADLLQFARAGVKGNLRVDADCFELNAQLGFLLGAFKDKIEREIVKNLDELLSPGA
jgi:putative polyhydroxyalkanoate system protein